MYKRQDPLLPLLVLVALAIFLVGIVLRALRQPHLIGYLLVGVFLGPAGIGILGDTVDISQIGAIGVVLVGFSESLAAARQYASKYHYDIDINQEMLAQGMANFTSGLFQGINVAGSLSKSSVNDASGAKSEMASLAQGVFVILTLLILAPLFADLPQAVLGAIVIEAVIVGLMDVKAMKRIYRLNRTEFWVGMIALLGVLTFGTLQGVLIGLLLSLLVLIDRSAKPNIPMLGRSPGTDIFHSLNQYPDSETYTGLVIIRFDGPLYFATANALRDKVRTVTTDVAPPVTKVLIDMEGVNYLDLEGSDMLNEIASNMKGAGVEIHLARVKHEVMEMLE